MLNILTEPVIRMDTAAGRRDASLPEVYAALMADEVVAFPALRPHQRHAWHAFLVQLGAMAMHRAGVAEPPSGAGEWAGLIRGLTPDWPGDEPWQLVVDDVTVPAFMQAPARSADKLADYKKTFVTPDELDMLVTSKNHDLKSAVAADTRPDDWLFALVNLQTAEGYGGSSNYGISRMASSFGNRSAFSITPSIRPGGHFRRDTTALLEHRQAILDDYPVIDSGIGITWVLPWDGTAAEILHIDKMGPFYVEICRRIRLWSTAGELSASRATSGSRRIYDTKGLTGDPWMPVRTVESSAGGSPHFLTHRGKLGYEQLVEGLFSPEWDRPYLLNVAQGDLDQGTPIHLVARGIVRNQGKPKLDTWGYHERVIPLKPKTVQVFSRGGGTQELEDIARERVADAGKVQRILRRAVATFAARGDSNAIKQEQRDLANPWVNQLGEIVDARFFEYLQAEFEVDDRAEREHIRNRWLYNGDDGVIDHAGKILQTAADALPCPAIHRYKARVQADSVFWGSLKGNNGFPYVFDRSNEEDSECPNSSQPEPELNPSEAQMTLFP